MSTNVVMPQMGESIAEGTIVRWIKKVGDAVDRDEPLFEISTDKVDAEIPAPAAGVLTAIKVKEGETVPVNSVVAVIGAAGDAGVATAEADAAGLPPPAGRGPRPPPGSPRSRGRPAPRRRRAITTTRTTRTRRGDQQGGSPPPEVVAAGAADREGAQRRHQADQGHRHQRARDQAGHPRLHQVRRRTAGAGRAAPSAPALPAYAPGRERQGRADERHAPQDRRAHGAERAHLAARVLGLRGELRPGRRAARDAQGRLRSRRRQADLHGLHRQGHRRRAAAVPDGERLDRRRQHRLQEGHQSRHRGRARATA